MALATGGRMPSMPLGDAWSGICRAAPAADWQPDPGTMQQYCNFGYAREKCARVPREAPDAVRFAISHDRDGLIGLYWVMEKDHLPLAHGPLEYSRAENAFHPEPADARVARQAHAYVSSYLRRLKDAGRL